MTSTPPVPNMPLASSNFPPGFRFQPDEYELLSYLIRRVRGETHPPNDLVMEVDLYDCNPDQLPLYITKGSTRWGYFFSLRRYKYSKGLQCNRSTPGGHWRPSGSEIPIRDENNNIFAFKRTLVFYWGKPSSEVKTEWVMREYRLDLELDRKMGDCVICKVYIDHSKVAKQLKTAEEKSKQKTQSETDFVEIKEEPKDLAERTIWD